MRIGTTPTHIFTLPEDIVGDVAKVRIVYAQGDKVVLCKDAELNENEAVVKLTQEDTIKFTCGKLIDIQVRLLMNDDRALTSDIITTHPYKCLDREVLK